MDKLYMGIDTGAITTKGIVIDKYDNIMASVCIYNRGNPIDNVKVILRKIQEKIDFNNYEIVSVGVTGSARKLVGLFLVADIVKNEITALAHGTIKLHPEVKTIFEIGGQDAKIISVKDGNVIDFGINTSCLAGSGSFIDQVANKLNIDINEINELSRKSKKHIDIMSRCAVFLETDLLYKIQEGYKREDILKGVCERIAINYLNGVVKGIKIQEPIVFTGGVSKNETVVRTLEDRIGKHIIVDDNSLYISALGIALMARDSGIEHVFDFNIIKSNLETRIINCGKCDSKCEMVAVYRDNVLIDHWGNRCQKGNELENV